MYEVEYLYEQLKRQTVEESYINVLNTVTENCYDLSGISNDILETVKMVDEAANNKLGELFEKFKANKATADKILKQYKDDALKCNPDGLEFKDYKTLVSDEEIKNSHKKVLAYLNSFNPNKASEDQLKKYILDSTNNVQYREMAKIFGNGNEKWITRDIVVKDKSTKQITKSDISKAVQFLQSYNTTIAKIQADAKSNDAEYTNYVRNNSGLATARTNMDINKLRKNASNHQRSLISIADSTYYAFMQYKMDQEFKQNKRIVIKAANYNPKNVKEATEYQNYIDSMYEFYEM